VALNSAQGTIMPKTAVTQNTWLYAARPAASADAAAQPSAPRFDLTAYAATASSTAAPPNPNCRYV
jgi:hypothetical protein